MSLCFQYSVFNVQMQFLNCDKRFLRNLKDLLSQFKLFKSGDDEIRTRDPLLARQVLSQLSYAPIGYLISGLKWTRTIDLTLIRRAL